MNLSDEWTNAVRQIVAEALASQAVPLTGLQATVTAVSTATPPIVTCSWNNATFEAAYNANYTPTVGHQVLVLLVGADPVIVGRVIGTP